MDNQTYKHNPVTIENLMTQSEIDKFCNEKEISKDIGKPLLAKLINDAVENGTYTLDEECKNNFQILFEQILGCVT